MTYGWAILAAIIAIGVLAYFGVFTPGQYSPAATILSPPFHANAWSVDTNNVKIEIRNSGEETYTSIEATLNSVTFHQELVVARAILCVTIPSGSMDTITILCTGQGSGDNFKADITITYRKAGSALDLTSTGTMTDKVREPAAADQGGGGDD